MPPHTQLLVCRARVSSRKWFGNNSHELQILNLFPRLLEFWVVLRFEVGRGPVVCPRDGTAGGAVRAWSRKWWQRQFAATGL